VETTFSHLDLRLAAPFRISRGVQEVASNLLVEVRSGGQTGWGEAAPSGYYGEKRTIVEAALRLLADVLPESPFYLLDASEAFSQRFHHGNAAAKAAFDMALYDLAGKLTGQPVYKMLGLNPARTPVSSFTIGIDTPARMAEKARVARDYPILKIKVGTENDLEIVRAIRDVTDATLRVDANAAWTPKEAIRKIAQLAEYDIEFVEQPVAPEDLDGLRLVREHSALPIIADESCVTFDDVAHLAGCADGINIKLMKCGGLTEAVRMIHAARALHMRVMIGCMIESSLAITAAAHLTPMADYADLDGPLLIADDPFTGVRYERGKLVLPNGPGLGVVRKITTDE